MITRPLIGYQSEAHINSVRGSDLALNLAIITNQGCLLGIVSKSHETVNITLLAELQPCYRAAGLL